MHYLKTHMFSGWWAGTIQRKPFVIMILVLTLLIFLFIGAFVLGLFGAENGVASWFGVSVLEAQDMLRGALSVPTYFVILAFQLAVPVIVSALCAKRLRDIGLPGWPIAAAVILIDVLLLNAIGVTFVFLLVLAVTPGAMFNARSSAS